MSNTLSTEKPTDQPQREQDSRALHCSLWIHHGAGHYIGSLVIVCAENKGDAEAIIREQLDKCGLKDEPLEVTEAVFSKNSVIVCNDGDY